MLTLKHFRGKKIIFGKENAAEKIIGGRMLKMKVTKKKVLTAALAVGLVATISAGTIAWFSDTDEVTNTFKIAESDDDNPDDIFSVDVQEDTPEDSGDDDGFTYEDVLPGDQLKKEPYAVNTGYYDQYIRAVVTVGDAAAWRAVLGDNSGVVSSDKIFGGIDTANWLEWADLETYDTDADTMTYVFYYQKVLSGREHLEDTDPNACTEKIFTTVKVPETMTKEQAVLFDNEFDINVKAQAVQTENVGSNALEAFKNAKVTIAD